MRPTQKDGGDGERDGKPFSAGEAEFLTAQVPKWTLGATSLERAFTFKDFREAMCFVNQVAEVAEAERHHPDITISYNTVRLELTTHKIGGLSEKDFMLAAKIDALK